MEKKKQGEALGPCKETKQAVLDKDNIETGKRRERLIQASREDLSQLAPKLAGRERESKEKQERFCPQAGGAGRWWREVVNGRHSAASSGTAVTPDWELGERVGGLLKQLDPG